MKLQKKILKRELLKTIQKQKEGQNFQLQAKSFKLLETNVKKNEQAHADELITFKQNANDFQMNMAVDQMKYQLKKEEQLNLRNCNHKIWHFNRYNNNNNTKINDNNRKYY